MATCVGGTHLFQIRWLETFSDVCGVHQTQVQLQSSIQDSYLHTGTLLTDCISLSLSRRAHTVTVLFILTCALVYVTLLEETPQDTAYNTKRLVRCAHHFLCVPAGPSRQPESSGPFFLLDWNL